MPGGEDAAGLGGGLASARLVARILDGDGPLEQRVLPESSGELPLCRRVLRITAPLHLPFEVLQRPRRPLPGVVHVPRRGHLLRGRMRAQRSAQRAARRGKISRGARSTTPRAARREVRSLHACLGSAEAPSAGSAGAERGVVRACTSDSTLRGRLSSSAAAPSAPRASCAVSAALGADGTHDSTKSPQPEEWLQQCAGPRGGGPAAARTEGRA